MNVGIARPQRMDLETIAFCNQSNMITSPIGFKIYLSPSELLDMADRGWGDKGKGATHTLDEAITLSRNQAGNAGKEPVKVMGKYIQAYVVVGNMPQSYLDDSTSEKYTYQMQAVCFYKDKDNNKQGITLLALKCKNPFKLIKRDEVFGRALGFGGAEELFEPQAWTTYSEIQKKEMMDAAAKIVHLSDDETFVKRNHNLKGVQNNEVLYVEAQKTVRQMDTYPRSMVLLEKSVNEWQEYAQQMGGAPNPLMGKEPTAGTPFALQNLVVQTGKNPHDFRRGQYAKFVEEMYRDWIIPFIVTKITEGKKFLSTLSLEEMQKVVEGVVKNQTNRKIIDRILDSPFKSVLEIEEFKQEIEIYKQTAKEDFMKTNEKFIEILKNDLKDAQINIKINVSKKQHDLGQMTDAVSNIMRQALSTYDPNTKTFAIFEDPRMAKMLNQVLEYSNMSSINFDSYVPKPVVPQMQPMMQPKQPIPAMAQ
jgi:hypothetical protein